METERKRDTGQFDFRKQRNTIDEILKITKNILERFRRGKNMTALFFI